MAKSKDLEKRGIEVSLIDDLPLVNVENIYKVFHYDHIFFKGW